MIMAVTRNKKTKLWDVQFYVKGADDKLKHHRKNGFKTQDEAAQYILDHKGKTLSKSMTVSQAFEAMSSHNRADAETTELRRGRLTRYAESLKDKPMRLVTKEMLQAWRVTLNDFDISSDTKNDIVDLIRMIFTYAYINYDAYDAAKVLKHFPKPLEDQHEYVIINTTDFKKLIDTEKDPLIKDVLTALYKTGARKGEIRALLKSDYNAETKQIHICKAMRRNPKSTKEPKTQGSIRYVSLDDKTAAMFEEYKKRPGKYMFGDYKPVSLTKLQDHFKADLAIAELPDMRLHDLRHSHVSFLWNAGVPVPEISKRIGHSSPAQTMRTYSHMFDNKQSASINALKSMNF